VSSLFVTASGTHPACRRSSPSPGRPGAALALELESAHPSEGTDNRLRLLRGSKNPTQNVVDVTATPRDRRKSIRDFDERVSNAVEVRHDQQLPSGVRDDPLKGSIRGIDDLQREWPQMQVEHHGASLGVDQVA
jgi:hypothetical protein